MTDDAKPLQSYLDHKCIICGCQYDDAIADDALVSNDTVSGKGRMIIDKVLYLYRYCIEHCVSAIHNKKVQEYGRSVTNAIRKELGLPELPE